MAKKKMAPAQAAAARRPDDWEPPQNPAKAEKASRKAASIRPEANLPTKGDGGMKSFAPFIILFVIMGIAAPFIVVFVSRLFGA